MQKSRTEQQGRPVYLLRLAARDLERLRGGHAIAFDMQPSLGVCATCIVCAADTTVILGEREFGPAIVERSS